jgi:hypothetical protein
MHGLAFMPNRSGNFLVEELMVRSNEKDFHTLQLGAFALLAQGPVGLNCGIRDEPFFLRGFQASAGGTR